MRAGARSVRLSERGFRALFNGRIPLATAKNPAMAALRKARRSRAHSGYVLPNQRRAYQALNVMGLRIWVNKPQQFKGYKWRARRATVARSIALREFQDSRAWQREGMPAFVKQREAHGWGVMLDFCTGHDRHGGGYLGLHLGRVFDGPIDAPEVMAAGAMRGNGFDEWPAVFFRGES